VCFCFFFNQGWKGFKVKRKKCCFFGCKKLAYKKGGEGVAGSVPWLPKVINIHTISVLPRASVCSVCLLCTRMLVLWMFCFLVNELWIKKTEKMLIIIIKKKNCFKLLIGRICDCVNPCWGRLNPFIIVGTAIWPPFWRKRAQLTVWRGCHLVPPHLFFLFVCFVFCFFKSFFCKVCPCFFRVFSASGALVVACKGVSFCN